METNQTKRNEELCKRWHITQKELDEGIFELCRNGLNKGHYKNEKVVFAIIELLSDEELGDGEVAV